MSASIFNEFTLRISIRATVPTLYHAWATPAGIEKWFLRSAIYQSKDGTQRRPEDFVQADDTYAWLWHGYDDSVKEKSTVLEANGKDCFRFGFSGGCRVAVRLDAQPDGSAICTLRQQMPMKKVSDKRHFYIECQKGWTFYLSNLKSIYEGGLDLRNRDASLGTVVNA